MPCTTIYVHTARLNWLLSSGEMNCTKTLKEARTCSGYLRKKKRLRRDNIQHFLFMSKDNERDDNFERIFAGEIDAFLALIFAQFDYLHNRLYIFIFHRDLEQGHHFRSILSHWNERNHIDFNGFLSRLLHTCMTHNDYSPRSRIDDFSTEFTASKFFCISTKFCCRIAYEPAMSSFNRFKLV